MQIEKAINEVSLTNNDITNFGDGFEKAIDLIREKLLSLKITQTLEEGGVYLLEKFTAPKVFNGLYFLCLQTDQKISVYNNNVVKYLGHITEWKDNIYKPERFNINAEKLANAESQLKTKADCLSDCGFSCKNLQIEQHEKLEKAFDMYAEQFKYNGFIEKH